MYLDASCNFSLPAMTIGIILALFYLLGKHPACRHTVYIVYVNVGGSLWTLL